MPAAHGHKNKHISGSGNAFIAAFESLRQQWWLITPWRAMVTEALEATN
jgi:hypothetical protein